jgi:GntR family transcriptional regulator
MTSLESSDPRIRKEPAPLYLQARRQILALIESGRFAPGTQLPREQELARTLGVSRPTVREALALLQIEGIVTRRHGSGNFVNHAPPGISARIDDLISIPRTIADHGLIPKMSALAIETTRPPERVARALGLPARTEVYFVERLYLASGRPAVWVNDYLPAHLVSDRALWEDFNGDMLQFLGTTCQSPVAYAVATIDVTDADAVHASHLRVGVGTGLLRITHTAYTATNAAVNYSIGYHRPGLISYSLIRNARP